MKVISQTKYQQARTCFAGGHSVIANLFLRAAYGVE